MKKFEFLRSDSDMPPKILRHGELYRGLMVKFNSGMWGLILDYEVSERFQEVFLRVAYDNGTFSTEMLSSVKWPIGDYFNLFIDLGKTRHREEVREFIEFIDEKHDGFLLKPMIIDVGESRWWARYIDTTHVFMANNPQALDVKSPNGVLVNHIAQLKDTHYYEEVDRWLKECYDLFG